MRVIPPKLLSARQEREFTWGQERLVAIVAYKSTVMSSPADPERFRRHGVVRVSADRTHLAHADGTPFFFLADTVWNGALLSSAEEWAIHLDDRAAKGFTAIQFITHAPWTGALADREGRTAFTGDPAREHVLIGRAY